MTEQTTAAVTCKFPGCENAPEPASGPGRPPGTAPTPRTTR